MGPLVAHNKTAVFEFRHNIDYLNCEILEYYGKRETTKAAVRSRLRGMKANVLEKLNNQYPSKNFRNVVID
jgi:outer membrane protein assembly factor BamD (BamD/ComL family)